MLSALWQLCPSKVFSAAAPEAAQQHVLTGQAPAPAHAP